jgi:hypothetical protein
MKMKTTPLSSYRFAVFVFLLLSAIIISVSSFFKNNENLTASDVSALHLNSCEEKLISKEFEQRTYVAKRELELITNYCLNIPS